MNDLNLSDYSYIKQVVLDEIGGKFSGLSINRKGKIMNAKEILSKQFEKAKIGGYKMEEVDDYLREVSDEVAQLQKTNNELERKLEVLADKIREYREDEDALKDALLIAQKQGNAIVADSKASAEKLTKETNEKVEKLLADSKAKSERMIADADAYSVKTRTDADNAAEKTINDANNKAAEIKAAMDKQQTIQENIIQQTRKESEEFSAKILAAFDEQIALIKSMPEKCENDFVKRTAEEAELREAERQKALEAQREKAKAEAAKSAAQQKAKEVAKAANSEKKTAQQLKPAVKPEVNKQVSVTNPINDPLNNSVITSDKTAENNLPFFNASNKTVTKHQNLKFGKNNNNKND